MSLWFAMVCLGKWRGPRRCPAPLRLLDLGGEEDEPGDGVCVGHGLDSEGRADMRSDDRVLRSIKVRKEDYSSDDGACAGEEKESCAGTRVERASGGEPLSTALGIIKLTLENGRPGGDAG